MNRVGELLQRLLSRCRFKPVDLDASKLRIYLPEQIAQDTAKFITSYGDEEGTHEGVAYWAGVATGKALVVTTVLAPEASTTVGSFSTSVVANAAVVIKVNEFHLNILAQVHGHPSGWVGHSAGDNAGVFMPYEGFYSVVVPWYGLRGLLPLTICGIHRYERGVFIRLPNDQVEQQFVVLPSSIDLRSKEQKKE